MLCQKNLHSCRRPDLKARAHAIKPVVWIGAAGLSENVMHELDQGLKSHELIKVKVASDERHTRTAFLNEICERLGARPVQHIGKILVIYRPQPEQIVTAEPKTVRKDRKPAAAISSAADSRVATGADCLPENPYAGTKHISHLGSHTLVRRRVQEPPPHHRDIYLSGHVT